MKISSIIWKCSAKDTERKEFLWMKVYVRLMNTDNVETNVNKILLYPWYTTKKSCIEQKEDFYVWNKWFIKSVLSWSLECWERKKLYCSCNCSSLRLISVYFVVWSVDLSMIYWAKSNRCEILRQIFENSLKIIGKLKENQSSGNRYVMQEKWFVKVDVIFTEKILPPKI